MELDKRCKDVLEKTEWIAISTFSGTEPHIVAAWGHRLREIGIQGDGMIVLPAGKYIQTENNLKKDSRIQMLIVSGEVERSDGQKGQGYRISGRGEIQTKGAMAELVKDKYPWARGALVAKIENVEALIS